MAVNLRGMTQALFIATLLIGSLSSGLPVPEDAPVVMPHNIEEPPVHQVNVDGLMTQDLQQSPKDGNSPASDPPMMIGPIMEETAMETPMGETRMLPLDGIMTQELQQAQKVDDSPASDPPVMIGSMVQEPVQMLPLDKPITKEPLSQVEPKVESQVEPLVELPVEPQVVPQVEPQEEPQMESLMQPQTQLSSSDGKRPDCPEMEEKMEVVVTCEEKAGDIFHAIPAPSKEKSLPEVSNSRR
ncbi:hypothetical protein GE061_017443 [Apolygus lucorum]|uniref:DUF4794 domain-containing protein n=1 Tax=Apolygus lucorum TaxID=248454 RepID=A0A6A4JF80_APOLU|nr:hypothetical protein GE061_017443 [Apolygus lucorum]